jgi:malto-oligosyltrehalose trehalohydrolase
MPFGAELTSSGAVRFRLWAPAARRVDLLIEEGARARLLPMTPLPAGWFELLTSEACAGTRYRYRIDGRRAVPDPASRHSPQGVHGPCEVIDAESFEWDDGAWRARPWHEAVIYELHVGTFSAEGSFAGVEKRLDHLSKLGVTAIELMPLAAYPGERGWGYDGVLPFAPHAAYGSPEALKSLIAAAHRLGLAVMLDVVYNHFGSQGNHLSSYAPQFFAPRHPTAWGAGINFDGEGSRVVRDFFLHNALYWLSEYHFDGLRFDAVQAIKDAGEPHFLAELAQVVRRGPGRERPIYLVLENGHNEARWLGAPGAPSKHDAQWNDDVHHSLHVLLTGEGGGYYEDYPQGSPAMLCRALAEGFSYQGEASRYFASSRGETSRHLPPTAFVNFLQNHDQVGNRARGERLAHLVRSADALRAAAAIVLLAPSPPLLFMGEEWQAGSPFLYFCDLEPWLAAGVRAGRRREVARFARTGAEVAAMPDPCTPAAFTTSKLDWNELTEPEHARVLDHHRRLLAIRARDIMPLIPQIESARCTGLEDGAAFAVDWTLKGGAGVLHLLANLADHPAPIVGRPAGRLIFATHPNIRLSLGRSELSAWSVLWLLERAVPAP